jgi:hypothetical protein
MSTRLVTTVLLIGITHAGVMPVRAQPIALDARAIEQAIEWGRSEDPEPYRIFHAPGEGRNRNVVGLVYTPYLRVALAARAADEAGLRLDPASLPAWLVAPVVHIAVRWYAPCELGGVDSRPAVRATTPDAMLSGVALGRGGTPPINELESAILTQFGGPPPFDDITHVVTYPLDLLRQDVDLLVFNRDNPDQLCVERGRFLRSSTETWR